MAADVVTRPTAASVAEILQLPALKPNQASLAEFQLILSTRRVSEPALFCFCY